MDNNTIKNGIIHVHSENSLKDSALKVETLCEKAFELGAPAITLTDHGTLTGVEEFMSAIKEINAVIACCGEKKCNKCKYGKNGIENCSFRSASERYVEKGILLKGIPGVEAYYEEDDNLTRRAHLLLLPKDYVGFQAISRAVTASNMRLDSQNIPRMNIEILSRYFGEGSEGHDHVIATSACMAGILASILLSNQDIEHEVAKLEKKLKKLYNPNSPQYIKNKRLIDELNEELATYTLLIKELSSIAKKPYVKKEKALKAFEGTPEYEARKAALDAEKAESAEAVVKVEELKKKVDSLKTQLRTLKSHCKEEEKHHERWYSINEQITSLKNACATDEELYDRAKAQAIAFTEIFGAGNFYAELQYHGIPEEKKVMPIVAKIAAEVGLPIVAANDAHMAGNSEDEIKARQIMRSLRFNQWEELNESDKELYIKTDAELSSILSEILPKDTVDKAMEGIADIVRQCNVEHEKESHYPKFKSEIAGESADECLRRKCYENIEWRFPDRKGWTEEYQKRLDYEIGVISKMGYSDYHLIVQDFLEYGRLIGKIDANNPPQEYLDNPYDVNMLRKLTKNSIGVGIGPGRGSGVGSLVCYLLGITSVNPLQYGLLFERFLNVERVSLPDIDSDFRPDIRNKVLDYVKHKYGEESVCCIMTRGTQQARAAVRNCARLLGSELHGDTNVYLKLGDEIAKSIPEELGIKFKDCMDALKEKFKNNDKALTILNNATLVEGTFTNIGMHAAGVIISDNGDVRKYAPLMYIPGTEQFAIQYDKDQCEALGWLKMDFLGLRNLGIINETIKLVQKRYGIEIDVERLPFEQDVFKKIFAEGNTNSVFQFESPGMKQMLKRFKPENIDDIILLVAAYRPGPIQYLDSIIDVKSGKKKPVYVIPEMESVLGNTYGSPIYQEQIMTIFNKFAGFSLGEADIIRRYMSKKKTEKFMAYKEKFIEGMVNNGAVVEKAEEFWEQLVEFSKYAFNRSHAAAYAFVAYYTAWLKYKYPKEYLCAVMNDTEFNKLGGLIGDCRAFGIKVLAPDINESEDGFSVKNDGILYGLSNVKNVGNESRAIIEERNRNGKFVSFADFMIRTKARKDVTESLIAAGAFDNFSKSRSALIELVATYGNIIQKIRNKEKIIEDNDADAKKKERAKASLDIYYDELNDTMGDDVEEDPLKRLIQEKEVIGAFVSAHPLDSYKSSKELGCVPIAFLSEKKKVSIAGIICNLRIANRKSDNSPMAFFQIEDRTGIVDVCCFAESFKDNHQYIKEDNVIKITGKCIEEADSFNDNGEKVTKVIVQQIELVEQEKPVITLYVPSLMAWTDTISKQVQRYHDRNGCPMILYDCLFGRFRKTDIFVSKEILSNQLGLETSI